MALLATGAALFASAAVQAASATGFATYFAVVAGNGNVSRSSGVASAARTSTGTYDVTFNRKINYCGTVASISNGGAGYASVDNKSSFVITVTTFAANGAKANLAFQVMVMCAP
jgi:hypothetical protein